MASILLASADPDQIKFAFETVMAHFSRHGHNVEIAPGGQSAMDRIRAHPPDVLLADPLMAFYDGVDLAKELKELRPQGAGVIMLVTISAEVGAAMRFQKVAYPLVDVWVVKPYGGSRWKPGGGYPHNYAEQMICSIAQLLLANGHELFPLEGH